MFDIPKKYKVGIEIAMKDFIPKDVKPNDKKRIQSAVKSAVLSYQIHGEEIPSVVNEDYNCSVIQFYDIQLTSIKEAVFIANVYQQMIKNLCVLRLYDAAKERFSFGLKRLSKTADNEVVLEDSFCTSSFLTMLPDKRKTYFFRYASFINILNKSSKVNFYREIYIKEYTFENIKIFTKVEKILEGPMWYDSKKMEEFYERIIRIKILVDKMHMETFPSDKVQINIMINEEIKYIENLGGTK